VQRKKEFETNFCFQLKIELVPSDDSVHMAIIPMAAEMKATLSVHGEIQEVLPISAT